MKIHENNVSSKQRILQAAVLEFAELGKAGARIDRIADRAGINKAMIYYHFDSKEDLYHATIAEHIVRNAAAIRSRISGDISLKDMISGIVEAYIQIFSHNPHFKQILLRELAEKDSPVIDKIADPISQSGVPDILYNKIQSEMEHGRVIKHDIKQTIASLISVNIGFFMISPLISKTLSLENLDEFVQARKEAVVDLLLNGVLNK